MILVGIIPGPKEPKLNINAYLEPLVDELRELWEGVIMNDTSILGCNVYRAALLCLAADILASRKCDGFVGHRALKERSGLKHNPPKSDLYHTTSNLL